MQIGTIVMLFLREETEDGEVKNLAQDSTVVTGRIGILIWAGCIQSLCSLPTMIN